MKNDWLLVKDLPFNTRAQRVFRQENIRQIWQLCKLREYDIVYRTPDFGPASAEHIKQVLATIGRKLSV